MLVDTDFLVLVETLGLYIHGYIDISRDTERIDRPLSRDIGFIDISIETLDIYIYILVEALDTYILVEALDM